MSTKIQASPAGFRTKQRSGRNAVQEYRAVLFAFNDYDGCLLSDIPREETLRERHPEFDKFIVNGEYRYVDDKDYDGNCISYSYMEMTVVACRPETEREKEKRLAAEAKERKKKSAARERNSAKKEKALQQEAEEERAELRRLMEKHPEVVAEG